MDNLSDFLLAFHSLSICIVSFYFYQARVIVLVFFIIFIFCALSCYMIWELVLFHKKLRKWVFIIWTQRTFLPLQPHQQRLSYIIVSTSNNHGEYMSNKWFPSRPSSNSAKLWFHTILYLDTVFEDNKICLYMNTSQTNDWHLRLLVSQLWH